MKIRSALWPYRTDLYLSSILLISEGFVINEPIGCWLLVRRHPITYSLGLNVNLVQLVYLYWKISCFGVLQCLSNKLFYRDHYDRNLIEYLYNAESLLWVFMSVGFEWLSWLMLQVLFLHDALIFRKYFLSNLLETLENKLDYSCRGPGNDEGRNTCV